MKKKLQTVCSKIAGWRYVDPLIVVVAIGIFVLLTSSIVTASSIWFDEAFSAYIVRFDFAQIATYTAADVHPPLYYWILKLWTLLFGTSEVAFRSLSIVLGSAALGALFMLARRLFSRHVAWLSVGLFAISPMLIRYGVEARMYMLVTLLVILATLVLWVARQKKSTKWWILYAVLVALGMYTHYFSAVVWIGHAVWLWTTSQTRIRDLWRAPWLRAYIFAAILFVPWLPAMVKQLGGIQGSGFWIGPVSADSLTNFTSNVLFYLEHNQVLGWFALLLLGIVGGLIALGIAAYRTMDKPIRQRALLIAASALLPVAILIVVSLPPLKSSFVERYLIPSIALLPLMASLILVYARSVKSVYRVVLGVVIAGSLLFGVSNVYHYGNYNKNSSTEIQTRGLVAEIGARDDSATPIIASSPWSFYEAVFYTSEEHKVWFIDEQTDYIYGSLDMLKDDSTFKITDIDMFTAEHQYVWYVGHFGDSEVTAPYDDWQKVDEFSLTSHINGTSPYKAALYKTR